MPILITCAPPSAGAPSGCIASSVFAAHRRQRFAFAEQERRAGGALASDRGRERGRPVALVDEHDRLRRVGGREAGVDRAGDGRGVGGGVGAAEAGRVARRHAHRALCGHRRDAGASSCRGRARLPQPPLPQPAMRQRRRAPAAAERADRSRGERASARHTSAIGGRETRGICGKSCEKPCTLLQASLHFASVPRPNAESLTRCQGTGDPSCWGESRGRTVGSAGSFSASPSANPAGRRKRLLSCGCVPSERCCAACRSRHLTRRRSRGSRRRTPAASPPSTPSAHANARRRRPLHLVARSPPRPPTSPTRARSTRRRRPAKSSPSRAGKRHHDRHGRQH